MASRYLRNRHTFRDKRAYRDAITKEQGTKEQGGKPEESFASHNQETGRYPSEEYPVDSYYGRNDEYRNFAKAGAKTRNRPES